MRKIIFTSDTDWAPEAVIADMLALFEEHGVPCTLFVTHPSEVVHQCNRDLVEVGIHPNFNPLLNGQERSADAVIDTLLEEYPEAKGSRAHSLTQSAFLSQIIADRGLQYESNELRPYTASVEPYRLWNGLVRVPFNWEDDVHFLYHCSYADCGLNIEADGLWVFNFHPMHVFLNTETEARYLDAKKYYHEADKLLAYRNTTDTPGARDLLLHLLRHVKETACPTETLSTLCQDVAEPYPVES